MFRRGNCDSSGIVDFTDAINTLRALFLGTFTITCSDTCDADDSGLVDITDPIHSLSFLFLGTVDIPAPGTTACGFDTTEDSLTCDSYQGCP
jgi:hypothetical protein